ncbi:PhzF family phenazine biosynthesis protein [Exiguobacterium sp. SRB7LM]|nr:PhzF family phenazine biosynthesis protein [Exiguobacterium sp. SRB7LM]
MKIRYFTSRKEVNSSGHATMNAVYTFKTKGLLSKLTKPNQGFWQSKSTQ